MKLFKYCSNHCKENAILYIITLAFFLRLPFRLPFLEDWDSVQLALALHNFSLIEHQPHPPGYPLYVLSGKFLNLFIREDVAALNVLSAILGSLSVLPFYLLVKKISDKKTAVLSSLLFIIVPVHWVFSEIALTDIPGLFFLLIAAYLIYNSKGDIKKIIHSSLFAGFILGFRFNEIPILLGLITLVAFIYGSPKYYLISLGSFIGGVLLWLIPLILITGFSEFIGSYFTLANYVVKHDIFLNESLSFMQIIRIKLEDLFYLLNLSYSGAILFLSFISIVFLTIKHPYTQKFQIQFLLVWILSYSSALLIIFNLESPRHTLPLFPPLIILITATLLSSIKDKLLMYPIFLIVWLTIFSQGLNQVIKLNRGVPATIKPVNYVRQNFDPRKTVVISSYTYRQFQYYAPEYKNYYSDKMDRTYISPDNTIIIDYRELKDKIANLPDFKMTGKRTFTGDKDIFTRIPEVTLYIMEKK